MPQLSIDVNANPLKQALNFILHPKIIQTLITLFISKKLQDIPDQKLPLIREGNSEILNLHQEIASTNSKIHEQIDDLENNVTLLETYFNQYGVNIESKIE